MPPRRYVLTLSCWIALGQPCKKYIAKAMATDEVSWPAKSKLRIKSRI